MLSQERRTIIMEMLRERNSVKISDIAARFNVSNLTARRDLDALQEQNLLRRVYGGAIFIEQPSDSPGVRGVEAHRSKVSSQKLKAIGKLAASMIQEGDNIFMGAGTTVLAVADQIRHMSNLTIFTNSLPVINELVETDNTIYVLGGLLDNNERIISGTSVTSMLKRFCADKAFIGCGGVLPQRGVMDYAESGAEALRAMVENAAQTVLVCASSKFHANALAIVCPIMDIDTIVTDDGLSVKDRETVTKMGIDLRLASVSDPDCEEGPAL